MTADRFCHFPFLMQEQLLLKKGDRGSIVLMTLDFPSPYKNLISTLVPLVQKPDPDLYQTLW